LKDSNFRFFNNFHDWFFKKLSCLKNKDKFVLLQ
jgi:hypothetical protein